MSRHAVILFDANVLVASLDLDASGHPASRAVVSAAQRRRLPGVLMPQVLLEAYAVITDARRVAEPLTPGQAWMELEALAHVIPVVWPDRRALIELAGVIERHVPKAQGVFDAFLVAQMRAAGIGTICTYNVSDFSQYQGINPEPPEGILARLRLPD